MAERDFDHPYLAVREPAYAGRTFLGGLRLSARTGLFVGVGLLAIVAFAGLIVYANGRLSSALVGQERAREMVALVTAIERGQADLRSREKQYLLTRDGALARDMRDRLEATSRALDALSAHADAEGLEKPIATLKDGFVQYDQHLAGLEGPAGADMKAMAKGLRDADEVLGARLATAGRGLADLLGRIDRLGGEVLLTGDAANLARMKDDYAALAGAVAKAALSRADRGVVRGLLDRHRDAMTALTTARVRLNDDAQTFDDIQTYVAPSLEGLRQAADDLARARAAGVADARTFAAVTLVGGGAAIILWVVTLGVVLIRSVTRPVQALAAAADRLARGDRTVFIPGRGNRDAVGRLARAFDDWIAATADAEHLRQDLEHAQARTVRTLEDLKKEAEKTDLVTHELEQARRTLADYRQEMEEMEGLLAEMVEADTESAAEAEEADEAAAESPVAAEAPAPTPPAEAPTAEAPPVETPAETPAPPVATPPVVAQPAPAAPPPAPAAEAGPLAPMAQVSQQLSQASRQASSAIGDVQLTESLVRNLSAATEQLDKLGGHVVALRERFNEFLFSVPEAEAPATPAREAFSTEPPPPPEEQGEDWLVPLSSGTVQQASLTDPKARDQLTAIGESIDRAARTFDNCRHEVDAVVASAQRLAAQASAEAKQATDQLLAQSAYLRRVLDGVSRQVQPPVQAGAKPVAKHDKAADDKAG